MSDDRGDTDHEIDDGPLSFLGRVVPSGLDLHFVSIGVGARLEFVESDWGDSLVVVERGEVELECVDGGSSRCPRGDVMWLAGLHLCALHNRGSEPAVLAVVSRTQHPTA